MTDHNSWYKTFFNGLALEVWDHAIPQEYTVREINFIKEILPPAAKPAILDIPCGSGRHSLPLAGEGYNVTGIDISEQNIQNLKQAGNLKGFPVEALRGDLLECEIAGEFDLAICLGNSFNYFPYNKTVAFVDKVSDVLKPGGKFLINTGVLAESIMTNFTDKEWYEMEGIFFLLENFYREDHGMLETKMIFIKNSLIERKTAFHFIHTLETIRRILARAGFESIDVFSNLERNKFRAGDPQAYILAGKS